MKVLEAEKPTVTFGKGIVGDVTFKRYQDDVVTSSLYSEVPGGEAEAMKEAKRLVKMAWKEEEEEGDKRKLERMEEELRKVEEERDRYKRVAEGLAKKVKR